MMTSKTRQKITTLYWSWCRRGRGNGGRSYSLADFLCQIKADREKRAKGQPALSLSNMRGQSACPLVFSKRGRSH